MTRRVSQRARDRRAAFGAAVRDRRMALGLSQDKAQKPPTPVLACQPMPAQTAAALRRGLAAETRRA